MKNKMSLIAVGAVAILVLLICPLAFAERLGLEDVSAAAPGMAGPSPITREGVEPTPWVTAIPEPEPWVTAIPEPEPWVTAEPIPEEWMPALVGNYDGFIIDDGKFFTFGDGGLVMEGWPGDGPPRNGVFIIDDGLPQGEGMSGPVGGNRIIDDGIPQGEGLGSHTNGMAEDEGPAAHLDGGQSRMGIEPSPFKPQGEGMSGQP